MGNLGRNIGYALVMLLSAGCDETDAEPEGVTPELREQALAAANEAEAAGAPARAAWDRAIAALDPSVGDQCPAEVLAAPRRERFVMVRSPRFTTDVIPSVVGVLERGFGHSIPALAHADRLRVFLGRDDGPRLREALATGVAEEPPVVLTVIRIDRLMAPVATASDSYRSGHLDGQAFLLDTELRAVCTMPVNSSNWGIIESGSFGGIADDFGSVALMELFEHAQTRIDREWSADGAAAPDEAAADRAGEGE
ncbi:MAG: hypothetical protein JRH11_08345 [Deltaproteobacteria bacterium]|nr:hypothetical protein [Deltaproteobacteria bacterium]